MAEAHHRRISKYPAISAGINVGEHEGEELPSDVLSLFSRLGYDMSNARRKQITPKIVEKSSKVVVMLGTDERVGIPQYISESKKAVYWDIRDLRDLPRKERDILRGQITLNVENLVKEYISAIRQILLHTLLKYRV